MAPPRLAYVVSRWGEPTQTFVRREAEGVAARGADVAAVSLRPIGPAASSVAGHHLGPLRAVGGALATFARHPRAAGRVMWTVATRSAPRNMGHQLVAAVIGLAWAGRAEVAGRSLHAHFGWVAATATWAAAQITGRPYTVVLHAFELHGERYQDRFAGVPLRGATHVYVISDADRAIVAARWGLTATTLRMGVPEAWLVEAPDPSVDPHLVVAVGSLVPKKGHQVLLAALATCPTPYRLEVIGAGPLEPTLVAQARSLGLADRVRFLGLLDEEDVRSRMRRAWVVVLAAVVDPSGDRDGIPVALMEAMASGVPVVSTRVGAIEELVEGAGVLVTAEDPDALAAALEDLCVPERRTELATAGLARVRADWTAERGAAVVYEAHQAVGG
jgi:glycosyltransferase involved in cell wall biosynthesis